MFFRTLTLDTILDGSHFLFVLSDLTTDLSGFLERGQMLILSHVADNDIQAAKYQHDTQIDQDQHPGLRILEQPKNTAGNGYKVMRKYEL